MAGDPIFDVTHFNITDVTSTTSSCTSSYNRSYSGSYYVSVVKAKPVESKKDKIKRIAKEKMLASHKTYDQVAMTIFKIKQICKPQHQIYNFKK